MRRPPLVWIILDGFGEAPPSDANAVTLAEPRCYFDLRERYPFGLLDASGESVGLPCGLMGNSEVGHLNMGAGRVVYQEISRIDRAIATGEFARNPALLDAFEHVQRSHGAVHLMGLVSDGGVHSSLQHLYALLDLARARSVAPRRLLLHAFLDGRDTPPRSAADYLAAVEERMAAAGVGRVATVSGRYYAMDRDQRWDRVRRAYAALTRGEGERADSARAAIEAAYARGEDDEFVLPTIVGDPAEGRIRNGDSVIFFNFRADRARQLTQACLQREFDGFQRTAPPEVYFATMTRYREDFRCPVAFAPQYLRGIFPEVVSKAGLTQLRIAETEKYAHVTFFFSGGDEKELPGERRVLIPSPRVATYDLQPEMSAVAVTDALLRELDTAPPDVTILNFANADMVGHTGRIQPAVRAVRTLDECLARIVPRVLQMGGHVVITADHGNCEVMRDPATGKPHTAHTTNPVPLLIVGADMLNATLKSGGRLCDIATTLLPLLGLEPDPAMEGVNLL